MVKTFNGLAYRIFTFRELLAAWDRVREGRRHQLDVLRFEQNLEQNLFDILDSLRNRTHVTGPYRTFKVFEPKERVVAALPLRDRVVQHALVAALTPIWEARFIYDSYACRVGKGSHVGADRAQHFLRVMQRRYGTIHVLKADVSKYFPSIRHDILKTMIRRHVVCEDTLWLIDEIIDSTATSEPGRGIPIGNLTSQLFANIYLHDLDMFVKTELRERYYLRYMDDFAVIGWKKSHMQEVRHACETFLRDRLDLRLNGKTQVFPVSNENGRPLDFLGYRIWTTHRKIRKSSAARMRRKATKLARQFRDGKIKLDKIQQIVRSWEGHACHADSFLLREAIRRRLPEIPGPVDAKAVLDNQTKRHERQL